MVDCEALDNIVRQTAALDATDGLTGERGRTPKEVLRTWLDYPDSLARVLPLILIRYRVASRPDLTYRLSVGDEPTFRERALQPEPRPSIRRRLFGRRDEPLDG